MRALAGRTGLFDGAHNPLGVALVTLLAIGLATLLMTAPVAKLFGPVVRPSLAWPFRRDPAPAPRPEERRGPGAHDATIVPG